MKKDFWIQMKTNNLLGSCPIPLLLTGVSVARWAAVTDRVCRVPVFAGDEAFPAGCKVEINVRNGRGFI